VERLILVRAFAVVRALGRGRGAAVAIALLEGRRVSKRPVPGARKEDAAGYEARRQDHQSNRSRRLAKHAESSLGVRATLAETPGPRLSVCRDRAHYIEVRDKPHELAAPWLDHGQRRAAPAEDAESFDLRRVGCQRYRFPVGDGCHALLRDLVKALGKRFG